GSWAIFCRRDWQRKPAAVRSDRTADDRISMHAGWQVLLWLTARQGRLPAVALALVGFLVGFLLPVYGLIIWPVFTLLAGVLCGTGMFAGEQTEGSYRFLGSQRLPVGRFWLVKLACWLAVAAGAGGLTLLGGAIRMVGNEDQWINATHSGTEFVLRLLGNSFSASAIGLGYFLTVWLVYGFAIGQILALVARKSAVAAVIAILLSLIVMGLWLPSLLLGGVTVWQVLAVPLFLLAVGRLVLWAWVGDRLRTWKPGLALAGCGVVAAAWIAGSLWYRTAQVPNVGEPVDVQAYEASLPTPEKNLAGRMIQLAAREFTDQEKKVGDQVGPPRKRSLPGDQAEAQTTYRDQVWQVVVQGWPKKDPELGRWLDRMFEGSWWKHLQEAAALPLGVVADPLTIARTNSMPAVQTSRDMANLLTARALQLQARGENTAALDRLVWVLALSRHLRHRAVQISYMVGRAEEAVALRGLDLWLDRLGPRPRLLRRALDELTRHEAQTPPPSEYVKAEYVAVRSQFDNLPRQLFQDNRRSPPSWEADLLVAAWQTPWERARHLRLLNQQFSTSLEVAEANYWQIDRSPRLPQKGLGMYGPGDRRRFSGDWLVRDVSPRVSPVIETQTLCRVRAERLRLALALYQVKEGKPAKTLDQLIDRYLPTLPLDPFNGKPFHYRISRGEDIEKIGAGGEDRGVSEKILGGQGVLWSVGPDLSYDGGRKDANDGDGMMARASSRLDLIFLVPRWPAR
ncbi:MAG TPA: hypothetical protein VG013_24435, partial [Gemmataceae bacterium]|nr:hypothetical protein [Gemmataceae bacterium]